MEVFLYLWIFTVQEIECHMIPDTNQNSGLCIGERWGKDLHVYWRMFCNQETKWYNVRGTFITFSYIMKTYKMDSNTCTLYGVFTDT